uniref:Uncharacterized protein n=1 Tax=viral metagenome TaxID=1070528 RepID=A0A6C0H4I9_9ZZZZ
MFCSICKKYKYPIFLCCKNLYCTNHAKLLYNVSILTIQKIYRGHKVRRILKSIYFKLPRDLQLYILSCKTIHKIGTKEYLKIKNIIKEATHKINDINNLSTNKITLNEINEILTILIKYNKFIDSKWFNYYKYYFNNMYSVLLLLVDIHDLSNTFTYLVSIVNNDIYDSLNLQPNLLNNNFKTKAKEILNNITLFLK